jgi:hypothetical protein
MNDLSGTIVAKSDQINAADLIGNPRTITIKEVRIKAGEDQPVSIMIEGDRKAFRPCKGVRRLLVRVWGADASLYIGQSMTLFHDPSVTWAGKEEGGIRVSHMSGLSEKIVEFMRVNRAATKPYEIYPLHTGHQERSADRERAEDWAAGHIKALEEAATMDILNSLQDEAKRHLAKLARQFPDLHQKVDDAYRIAEVDLAPNDNRRADHEHGDQHDSSES